MSHSTARRAGRDDPVPAAGTVHDLIQDNKPPPRSASELVPLAMLGLGGLVTVSWLAFLGWALSIAVTWFGQ